MSDTSAAIPEDLEDFCAELTLRLTSITTYNVDRLSKEILAAVNSHSPDNVVLEITAQNIVNQACAFKIDQYKIQALARVAWWLNSDIDYQFKSAEMPATGTKLFRKYLLLCCQREFELREITNAVYTHVQKLERWRNLAIFIANLYNLCIVNARIVCAMVKQLTPTQTIGDYQDQTDLEMLHLILQIGGRQLESVTKNDPRARAITEPAYQLLADLAVKGGVDEPFQKRLQHMVELRQHNWSEREIIKKKQQAAHAAKEEKKAALAAKTGKPKYCPPQLRPRREDLDFSHEWY